MAITLWENTRDRLTPTRLYSSEYGSLLNFVETPVIMLVSHMLGDSPPVLNSHLKFSSVKNR